MISGVISFLIKLNQTFLFITVLQLGLPRMPGGVIFDPFVFAINSYESKAVWKTFKIEFELEAIRQ